MLKQQLTDSSLIKVNVPKEYLREASDQEKMSYVCFITLVLLLLLKTVFCRQLSSSLKNGAQNEDGKEHPSGPCKGKVGLTFQFNKSSLNT